MGMSDQPQPLECMHIHENAMNPTMGKSNIFGDTAIFKVYVNILKTTLQYFLLRVISGRFTGCDAIPRVGRINPCNVGEISPIFIIVMRNFGKTTRNTPKTTRNDKNTINMVNCSMN